LSSFIITTTKKKRQQQNSSKSKVNRQVEEVATGADNPLVSLSSFINREAAK